MHFHKEVVFLVLTALATVSAFHTLVPSNKELTYTYRAVIKSGTQLPLSYASAFILEGTLHLQSTSNASLVRLSDLTFRVYNGIVDHEKEQKGQPVRLPDDFKDLEKVFKIVYDHSGKVMGIATHPDENESVRNMKKAIAAVLQMDVEHISLTSQTPHAFTTDEQSIYGKGPMVYTVVPHGDVIKVHKLHEMRSVYHMFRYLQANVERLPSDTEQKEQYLQHDSQRRYMIIKQEDHHVVKYIEANGGIYMLPFGVHSEAYYVYSNQTMHLVDMKPIQQQMEVKGDHFEYDITHYMYQSDPQDGYVPDVTHGRHHVEMDVLISKVQSLLEEVIMYMKEDHIHMASPDTKHAQVVNRLKRDMKMLSHTAMEQLHTTLIQKVETDPVAVEVFYQMLPLIGSHASMTLIKDLVMNNKVKEHVAVHMLKVMPFHVQVPTKMLITDMEPLMQLADSINWEIRKAALLSFATLIHKSHTYYYVQRHKIHGHDQNSMDIYEYDHVEPLAEMRTMYDKYVHDLVSKLRAATDYKHQQLYLDALQNIRLESVGKYLKPAIEGKWWDDRHLRLLAMWAASHSLVQSKESVYEVFWPILSDRTEHSELRAAAYYVIMESQPSVSELLNIYWQMQHEPDQELYRFYYTHTHAIMGTKDPCKQTLKMHLKGIMKFMPAYDRTRLSGFYQMDFTDLQYPFGGGINGFLYSTNSTKIFSVSMTTNIMGLSLEPHSIFVKIVGLEHALLDKFMINTQSSTKLFNYDEMMEMIKNMPNNKNIRIEAAIFVQTHIVQRYYYDHSNIDELSSFFNLWKDHYTYASKKIHIDYEMNSRLLFPSDLGMPVSVESFIPDVTKHDVNITKEGADKIINWYISHHFKKSMNNAYGMSFYNPIVDAWQGIHKMHTFDIALPIHMDVSVNTQQQKMKITWKRDSEAHKNVLGLRSHVSSKVFVRQYSHVSSKPSHHNYHDFETVTYGDDYRHNFTLVEKDDSNTGYHYHIAVYDAEPTLHVTNGSYNAWLRLFGIKYTKNYMTPLDHWILTQINMYSYLMHQPRVGVHGYMAKMAPSTEYPVTHIDISLRLTPEIKRDVNILTPALTVNGRITYAVKNAEKAMKTWDVNSVLEFNSGHTQNNWRMQLTRIIPGQNDFKVCLDATKKYTNVNVIGHMNVAMSHSADNKCTKDETVMDIVMTGTQLKEQMNKHHIYGACSYPRSYFVRPDDHTMSCLSSYTTLRQYIYNIKMNNVQSEFKKMMQEWMDYIKGSYMSHYTFISEHEHDIPEHNMKVKVEYPLVGDMMDVMVMGSQNGFKLEGIDTKELSWFGAYPDNTHYSKMFMFMHAVGLTNVCIVQNDVVLDHYHHHWPHHLTTDWTLVIGDDHQKMFGVFAKKIDEHKMAIKLVHESDVMEVTPEGEEYQLTLNGQQHRNLWHHHEDWVSYTVLKNKKTDALHPVEIMLPHVGVHVKYDGYHVKIEVPRVDIHLQGTCVIHN